MQNTTAHRRGVTRLEVTIASGVVILFLAIFLPAMQRARDAARLQNSRFNLRQLGFALTNYHEAYRRFPPGGTVASDGRPLHGWSYFIQSYIAQVAPHRVVDQTRPWDDPVNFAVMRDAIGLFPSPYQNPSLEPRTPAGMLAMHYAPNQRILHRQSAVTLKDIPDQTSTLLLADAFEDFSGFGDPIWWRDATVPLRSSRRAFGNASRRAVTLALFVDGHSRDLSSEIDPAVSASFAGDPALEPDPARTALRPDPYQPPPGPVWEYKVWVRSHKGLAKLGISPGRSLLVADLGYGWEREEGGTATLCTFLHELIRGTAVKQVRIEGGLDLDELRLFAELPAVQELDLSEAQLRDNATELLRSRPHLKVQTGNRTFWKEKSGRTVPAGRSDVNRSNSQRALSLAQQLVSATQVTARIPTRDATSFATSARQRMSGSPEDVL